MTHDQQMMVFAIKACIADGRADVAGKLAAKLASQLSAEAFARATHRPHSLIKSQRSWQKVASANGVAAWGYAYENGEFNR